LDQITLRRAIAKLFVAYLTSSTTAAFCSPLRPAKSAELHRRNSRQHWVTRTLVSWGLNYSVDPSPDSERDQIRSCRLAPGFAGSCTHENLLNSLLSSGKSYLLAAAIGVGTALLALALRYPASSVPMTTATILLFCVVLAYVQSSHENIKLLREQLARQELCSWNSG
jgi:hypothetical protein